MTFDNTVRYAKVVRRKKYKEGNLLGSSHSNPLEDTCVYEVDFPDCSLAEYGANLITTAMFAQVEGNGHRYQNIDEIVDHQNNNAAPPTRK